MIQLAFDGIKTTNQVWKSAEATLANNWSSIYTGADRDNYYALYAAVKALRLARPRPVTRFEATGVDWYYDPAVGVEKKVLGDQASDGSWDVWYRDSGSGLYRDLSTAWGVMMLTPGIVGQPPVAVLSARQTWKFGVPLRFYASKSFHIDPARRIIRYAWDFDNDGATDYDTVDPDDPAAVRTWSDPHPGTAGDPPQYVTVTLRVKDDNAPALYDEASVTVCVRESPLAPYAVAGGPYVATAGVAVVFNGSQSFDLDTGDSITKYEWDLTHDDVPDLATNAASVRVVYPTPGQYYVGLRVTDQGAFNGGTNLVSEWAYTTVTVLPPDTDGDGMPDAWELQYFGNVTTASASSDWDGDHLPDLYEYLAGTDPTNGLSVLKINRTWKTATNSVTVQWQSQTSHAYRVLRSTNLLVNPPFGVIQTGIPGLPGDTPYTDTNLPSARTFYYRVELDQ
jgi:hypothetical protein